MNTGIFAVTHIIRYNRGLCYNADTALRKKIFGTIALCYYSGVPLYSKKLILHERMGNLYPIPHQLDLPSLSASGG